MSDSRNVTRLRRKLGKLPTARDWNDLVNTLQGEAERQAMAQATEGGRRCPKCGSTLRFVLAEQCQGESYYSEHNWHGFPQGFEKK